MRRRDFLGALAAGACLTPSFIRPAGTGATAARAKRVRPGEPGWPSPAHWEDLRRQTGGRLIEVRSPLAACRETPAADACADLFRKLKNPYYIGDEVGLTQTTGWLDAWTFQPSVYAVAAETAADVAAAVTFARDHNLRLVVKGGGHSYLGRSNAPDSLLVWTRHMNRIERHDGFLPSGCAGDGAQPAVSIGAGAIWGRAYTEVTTRGGRYVQGGGCLTVGVAGLVQAGGFGSFSKRFGTAAASLLEAEIVTADGAVRIANRCTNPDLFWALKGGGGGSFGVVTRLTLKTHELPATLGIAHASIVAASSEAFKNLVGQFFTLYAERLHNPHWGEIVTLRPGRRLDIRMSFQGLEQADAAVLWRPFFDWVAGAPSQFSFRLPPDVRGIPARHGWDPAFLNAVAPGAVIADDRPGAAADNVFWSGNLAEAGHFIFGYESVWLPEATLREDQRNALVDALCDAGGHAPVELHFQKGLAGGSPEALAATRATATNPEVLDAFALAIVGGEGPPADPGVKGHEPDLGRARRSADAVGRAIARLRSIAPAGGSYFAESGFFEPEWQKSYWGANYPRLRRIKEKYDPAGLFFVHHGVGSEEWSADGFTPVAAK